MERPPPSPPPPSAPLTNRPDILLKGSQSLFLRSDICSSATCTSCLAQKLTQAHFYQPCTFNPCCVEGQRTSTLSSALHLPLLPLKVFLQVVHPGCGVWVQCACTCFEGLCAPPVLHTASLVAAVGESIGEAAPE